MTVRHLFRADRPAHGRTEELLPWYVNGTLDGDERARVEAHLAHCLHCRRELAAQRELQAMLARDEAEVAVGHALARAHARIDRLESRWRPVANGRRVLKGWRRASPWVRAVLLGQLALVLTLGLALVGNRDEAHLYRTLGTSSAPAAPAARLAFVADRGAREDELRAVLVEIGARVVAQRDDEYTVEVAPERSAEALRKLRASAAQGTQ